MYLILIGIVGIVILLLGTGSICRAETPRPQTAETVTPADKKRLTDKKEIRKQLQELARKAPPIKLAMGAMCYEMAAPPNRIDYVCTTCGEKTLYASEPNETFSEEQWLIHFELQGCRRLVKEIKTLNVSLDEAAICKHCSPEAKERIIVLVVKYNDGSVHRTAGVTMNDLTLLKEFSEGKTKHKTFTGFEEPLKKHIPRIEELLGVSLKYESTQAEIRKNLRVLAEAESPKKLSTGAMCYIGAGSPQRAEYSCQTCGEKTLYAMPKDRSWDNHTGFLTYELHDCRRLISQIKGLNIRLDESEFCNQCNPDKKSRSLRLVLQYPIGGEPHSARATFDDIKLLKEFMDGELIHQGDQDYETPLKDHLPRLQKLLGVSLDD